MKYFIIILLLFSSGLLSASPVIIKGNAPDYAGKNLNFLTYSNFISEKEVPVASAKVAANGDFLLEFETTETKYVFCHSGIFLLYLFAEPGKEYTVKLPGYIEKKREDKLNPFFEEVKLHMVTSSVIDKLSQREADKQNELNNIILRFDDYFDSLYGTYATNIYTKQSTKNADSTLKKVESEFSGYNHPYFKEYFRYRLGLLKFLSTKFRSRSISDDYFLNKPVLYDNPAYMELFNKIYDKYFVYFGRTKSGKIIYDDINKDKSLSKLKATLGQDKVLTNDTLKEMVILKGIHDGCYEMEFKRGALLQILDSLINTTSIAAHRRIGEEIRYKITRLLPGYTPPDFHLLNQDSVMMSLKDLKGSLVYLVFATTQNYACLKEFDLLKKFQQKHPNLLKIVVISADENLKDVQYYARKSQLKWTFLHYGNQADILKDYDIRTIPTCFFLDKEGKLAMSPAPLPSESFEAYLFNWLKVRKIL